MIEKELVPRQTTGAKTDVTEKIILETEAKAIAHYKTARLRLLKIYNWDEVCELPSSVFILLDKDGNKVKRNAMVGDFFKIDIPAPGNATGDGFDWVMIEKIVEEKNLPAADELTAITVRPCPNPFDNNPAPAHFFDDNATSTFIVKRKGNEVAAEVHGRNETANTETGKLITNIRNALVAWGAKFGFSFPQWKSLVVGIVKQ